MLNDNINKLKTFWSQIKNVFPGKSQSIANVSTDKRPSLNILVAFTVQWHQSRKNTVTYLQILPDVILQNLHQKLRKLLDFHIFQYYLCKKS